jgi:hypothetical protein
MTGLKTGHYNLVQQARRKKWVRREGRHEL